MDGLQLVKSKNLSSQLARSIRQELFNAIDALATSYEFVRLLCVSLVRCGVQGIGN